MNLLLKYEHMQQSKREGSATMLNPFYGGIDIGNEAKTSSAINHCARCDAEDEEDNTNYSEAFGSNNPSSRDREMALLIWLIAFVIFILVAVRIAYVWSKYSNE